MSNREQDESPRGPEAGSGTVLAVAVIAVALVVTLGGLALAAWSRAAQRAATAADLGALAGATAHVGGAADPCAAADLVIRANGAVTERCQVLPDDSLQVRVSLPVRLVVPLGPAEVAGTARAGPVPVGDDPADPGSAMRRSVG